MLGIGDPLGVQAVGEDCRQRALADPYRTFNCDVPREIKKLGHEFKGGRKTAFENIPRTESTQLRKELTGNQERPERSAVCFLVGGLRDRPGRRIVWAEKAKARLVPGLFKADK